MKVWYGMVWWRMCTYLIISGASLEQFNNGFDGWECAIVLVPVPQAL